MTKLKAAIIGAGWFAAESHIPALAARPEVVLDGVCRKGAAELERVHSHFGFAFASEDHRAVLERRPDIVVVSSPHHLHYRHAADAIAVGAHVLCEKPMTLDPAEAWDLVRMARERGVHLLIANAYHYLPHADNVRAAIQGGEIGELESVLSTFISATRPVFSGGVGFKRWNTTFFRPDRATWQDPAQGGGFAYGQMSHSIALMLWMTGLSPAAVHAHTVDRDRVDLCDAASVLFSGGAVGTIHGAAAWPEGGRALMRLFVTGSKGTATLEFDRDRCEIHHEDGSVRRLQIKDGEWQPKSRGPTDALVDLALGRGVNRSPGEIGAATVATIAAILKSSAGGGTRAELAPPGGTKP